MNWHPDQILTVAYCAAGLMLVAAWAFAIVVEAWRRK